MSDYSECSSRVDHQAANSSKSIAPLLFLSMRSNACRTMFSVRNKCSDRSNSENSSRSITPLSSRSTCSNSARMSFSPDNGFARCQRERHSNQRFFAPLRGLGMTVCHPERSEGSYRPRMTGISDDHPMPAVVPPSTRPVRVVRVCGLPNSVGY